VFKLPASFMASFFALAINQFPRNSSNMLDLNYVVKYMCKFRSKVVLSNAWFANQCLQVIFTAVVATFFILMAFQINEIVALAKKFIRKDPKNVPNQEKKGPILEEIRNLKLRGVWNKIQGKGQNGVSLV
jgi:hypothetical protein